MMCVIYSIFNVGTYDVRYMHAASPIRVPDSDINIIVWDCGYITVTVLKSLESILLGKY